jgi:hypothetical protein
MLIKGVDGCRDVFSRMTVIDLRRKDNVVDRCNNVNGGERTTGYAGAMEGSSS